MKPTIKIIAAFVVVTALLLASCKEGPLGINPGQELEVSYTSGIATFKIIKRAEVMVSGDSIAMQTLPMMSDTIVAKAILFDVPAQGVGLASADMVVGFKALPTSPGTYAWSAAIATATGGATVIDGIALAIEYGTFYGSAGSTTITEVRKDGNGNITGYRGYINGTLKSVWPKGFNPGFGGIVPPGFDISNPTFVGEEITLHSCPFNTRSNSSVPVVAPID